MSDKLRDIVVKHPRDDFNMPKDCRGIEFHFEDEYHIGVGITQEMSKKEIAIILIELGTKIMKDTK